MIERTFDRVGGHPALDFVNTLDERLSGAPEERLASYADLLSFLRQAHLIKRAELAALRTVGSAAERQAVLARALRLREAAHHLLRALRLHGENGAHELSLIGREIADATAARRLARAGRTIRWQWIDARGAWRPLHELALALSDLFASDGFDHVRKCAAEDCGVWFMDRSHAAARRWCDMKTCGNRAKLRRFRS